MDQIGEYMTHSVIIGLLGVSVLAAVAAMAVTRLFLEFFEILEGDE